MRGLTPLLILTSRSHSSWQVGSAYFLIFTRMDLKTYMLI